MLVKRPDLSLAPSFLDPAAFLPSSVSGEATLSLIRGREQRPAFSGLWSALSKMVLAYFCNISILQREGPRETWGQRSHGVNLLFLSLPPHSSSFLYCVFQWPRKEVSIPPLLQCPP